MPGSERIVPRSCGLQARRTTDAERTPWTLLERSTSSEGENREREVWIFLADSGRVTQAMKCFGISAGKDDDPGELDERCESRRARSMPERTAMPRVPAQCNC